MVYANGSKYVGRFYLGEREGLGLFECYDGERYEGEWKANLKEGCFKGLKKYIYV